LEDEKLNEQGRHLCQNCSALKGFLQSSLSLKAALDNRCVPQALYSLRQIKTRRHPNTNADQISFNGGLGILRWNK
jgi:hypothetical protein